MGIDAKAVNEFSRRRLITAGMLVGVVAASPLPAASTGNSPQTAFPEGHDVMIGMWWIAWHPRNEVGDGEDAHWTATLTDRDGTYLPPPEREMYIQLFIREQLGWYFLEHIETSRRKEGNEFGLVVTQQYDREFTTIPEARESALVRLRAILELRNQEQVLP